LHRAWLHSILSFQLRKGPRQRKFGIGRAVLSSRQCSLTNPDRLAKLTLTQVLPWILNPGIKGRQRTAGRTGTRMRLLLKATDAQPKHSFFRLQRLLRTSIAECLQLYEPKNPFFLGLMHTKLFCFSPSVHSRQFASCQGFCCHCYCFTFGNQKLGCGRWRHTQLPTDPA